MKKVRIIAIVALFALLSTPVWGATVLKKISVELNTYVVKVNGKAMANDNIVYNGNIYIRADKISESIGKAYKKDTKTKIININDKGTSTPATSEYSFSNPAPIGTIQTIQKKGALQAYTIEAKINEIVRGDKAWERIQAANMLNDPAKDGYEFILAKIYFKVNDITKDQQYDLAGISFTLVSSSGKDYDYSITVAPEPRIDAKLYKDATSEGWAVYQVKKDDLKPKLVFGRDYNGSGGIWFKAYTE